MSSILRPLLLVVVVFAVVWGGVALWWNVADIQPTERQSMMWLVGLPVLILASWWTSRLLIRGARHRREAKAASSQSQPQGVSGVPGVEQRSDYRLRIVASAVQVATGDTPSAVLAASRQTAALRLHPTLKDHRGLPVFCASVEDIDGAAAAEALAAHGVSAQDCSDEQGRSIALLERVAEALFSDVLASLPVVAAAESRVVAGVRRDIDAPRSGRITIRLLLSQGWPPGLRQATSDWLLAMARDHGVATAASTTIEIIPVASGMQVWSLIDRLGCADAGGAGDAEWTIVIAADSLVGERSVDALQAAGLLMTAERPEGILLGEGAAGVVFHSGAVHDEAAEQSTVILHAHGRGDAPPTLRAREAGKVTADVLQEAMRVSATPSSAVAGLLSDADQRPGRAVEARSATSGVFANLDGLDPEHDYAALGAACGYLGHVAPLALLATAVAWVNESSRPIMALAVSGSDARIAAVLSPPSLSLQDAGTVPVVSA